jgi:ubiquinone biosynthesis protein COQ4
VALNRACTKTLCNLEIAMSKAAFSSKTSAQFDSNSKSFTLYDSIKPTFLQKTLLGITSGLVAINDPTRDDMISAFGELTAKYTLPRLHRLMENDAEGSLILKEKPIINSKTVDLNKLAKLPSGSFGYEYVKFLDSNQITPDSRKQVMFIEENELAYVMTRYRQIHDFTHCILGMRTNMLGEVTVKIFEAIQLGLPMCWLAGLFGMLRLGPKHTKLYIDRNLPWVIANAQNAKPLISVYFERHFEKSIDQLRKELNLTTLSPFNEHLSQNSQNQNPNAETIDASYETKS